MARSAEPGGYTLAHLKARESVGAAEMKDAGVFSSGQVQQRAGRVAQEQRGSPLVGEGADDLFFAKLIEQRIKEAPILSASPPAQKSHPNDQGLRILEHGRLGS